MKRTDANAPQDQDSVALLPWYATGTLDQRDAERVEQALANDGELNRQYEMVREELSETIHLNETLGAPSARAMEGLIAGIEADSATARKSRVSFNIGAWVSGHLSQLSPRTLAWSATAAALAIVLQAGLIAGLYVETAAKGGKGFETASYEQPTGSVTHGFGEGSSVLVRFTPDATAKDITNFLETYKAAMVEGPRAQGLFRLRIAETSLTQEEVAQIVARIQADKKIIIFVTPAK
jgi:hypothetical protein